MTMTRALVTCLFVSLITGCAGRMSPPAPAAVESMMPADASLRDSGSLFPADQAVLSDAQIEKVFATRIGTPPDAKLAVVRYGSWPRFYWSEEFARLDQQSLDGFLATLRGVPTLRTVQVVPEMLVPRQMDVPHLRETAARVQADLLLIYRPTSHSYQKSRFLKRDQTRAYCTVEVALLDTRSGVVTYTARATENYAAEQSPGDMSFDETVGRAEQEAVGRAMARVGEEVAAYVKEGDRKAGGNPPATRPATFH